MSQLYQVFVYGTLKTGQPNNHVMHTLANGEAKLIGTGRTVSRYPLVISSQYNIPFLLYRPDHGHVSLIVCDILAIVQCIKFVSFLASRGRGVLGGQKDVALSG